ncbi:hypothetical protein KC333_g3448 [Hortaea werneckii]|nr:hypothetical protein KC333_g3448 [Hortaea werneckii]KAI7318335.1 hypothetical protein KC326_g3664 [Hortaea werneckii]
MSLKTTVQWHDNGDIAISADMSLETIDATFKGGPNAEVTDCLHAVTCSLAGGLMKAVQGQKEAAKAAKGPKEIEDTASKGYHREASVDRVPVVLNCATSGGFTIVFTFAFQKHKTMCEIGFGTLMYEAMDAFALHAEEHLENLRFSYCDRELPRRSTPMDLDMTEGDVINVIRYK